jgi:glycosyltransferase involved in cell wall biosynthesis
MSKNPRCSIVIPTYLNDPTRCIESIIAHTDPDRYELILVCNGATPETKALPSKLGIPATILWFDNPVGFSRACNAGIKESHGDLVLLLNDDCQLLEQPKNQWLDLLAAPFDDPQVGITGSHKLWDNDTQHEFIIFFCAMLRRSMLDQIGVLDEELSPFYGEDIDLCIRAERAGWKCIPVGGDAQLVPIPNSDHLPEWKRARWVNTFPIAHEGESTLGQLPEHTEVVERNRAKLRAKYRVDIDQAKQIEGWMSEYELAWLATQAKSRNVIVEIGSHCGRSTRAFADNLPTGGRVFAVDKWEDDEVYQKFHYHLADHINAGRVIPLRVDGAIAARALGVKPELIFIDGAHDESSVRADILNWQPLLAENGLLCGHDYHPDWPDVIKVVDELLIARQPPNTGIWEAVDGPDVTDSVEGYGGFFCTEKQANSLSA